MALRIKSNEPSVEEAIPVEEPVEQVPVEEPMPMEAMPSGGTIDPLVARYLGPMDRCQSCIHYLEPGQCEIVAGPIDPQGVCSLFTADQVAEDEMPVEEVPTEIPPSEY